MERVVARRRGNTPWPAYTKDAPQLVSSVHYELALYSERAPTPSAEGWFVHAFVDRESRRPEEIPAGVRAALERLLVEVRWRSRYAD